MASWMILIFVLQNLLGGKALHLENSVANVGETTPILMQTDSHSTSYARTICTGDDILREAVEVLQMDAIEKMETNIGLLEQENEEKGKIIKKMKRDNVEKITKMNNEFEGKLQQIERENKENIARITESFESDLQQQITKENLLKEALSGKTTLVNYLKIVLRDSQGMMRERQDTIDIQAKEIIKLQSNLEQCKQMNSENLKIVFSSQESMRKQNENIARLDNVMKLNKNLTKSYENISKNDLVKNNCKLAPWIENLTGALTEQKEKINELTSIIEGNDKIEEHLNSIQTNLSKVKSTVTEEECAILPKYQKLIMQQSKSISMLRILVSYALNSTSAIRYEKGEDGRLVSASTCQCIPHPPKNSNLEVSSIEYECREDRNNSFNLKCEEGSCENDHWPTCNEEITIYEVKKLDKEGTWHLINCQEVYVGYLNGSVFCGEGRRIGKVERTFGKGKYSQEISVPCNECEEEMFQWSPWNNIKNKHMRWRGSKNVTNTYQEEESSLDPQCSEPYTTLNDSWRRIEYGVPHSPYHCDILGHGSSTSFTPGWHRFSFPGSPNATIPTTPAPQKYRNSGMESCGSHGVNWMEGSLPVIREPIKNIRIHFAYVSNDKQGSIDAKIVACQEDGQNMYLYYLDYVPSCYSFAYCAL